MIAMQAQDGFTLFELLVAMLNNLLNFSGVSSYYQWVLQGVIILIAVGLRSKAGES